jgi:hypothetical protein
MQRENPSKELLFVYSEPQMDGDRFAIGLVLKEAWAEVREDYIEPILVRRFPLNLLHPESVVHLMREAPLPRILSAGPTAEGVFVAALPRRTASCGMRPRRCCAGLALRHLMRPSPLQIVL